VKLLIQPGAGVKPLLEGIDQAKKTVEIVIFRFDRTDVEKALVRAVERGVFVHALIAYTNRGGEKNLRQLEMRLLAKGVTVARTADDLVRYHSKFLIVDSCELYVLAFNFTYLDMEHSRSFAVITKDEKLVEEASKLFEADTKRQKYEAGSPHFVVSPVNARKELTAFIKAAEKTLIIYDPKIGDPAILKALTERVKSGVAIRTIGKVSSRTKLDSRELLPMRLHTRSMVRDGEHVFLGSQSLRTAELETRREVGLVFHDEKIAASITKTFEADWAASDSSAKEADLNEVSAPLAKAAKRVAKALTRNTSIERAVKDAVREVTGGKDKLDVDPARLEQNMMDAVKEAVEESVRDAMQEVTDH
jgi:cardiolipin synthase